MKSYPGRIPILGIIVFVGVLCFACIIATNIFSYLNSQKGDPVTLWNKYIDVGTKDVLLKSAGKGHDYLFLVFVCDDKKIEEIARAKQMKKLATTEFETFMKMMPLRLRSQLPNNIQPSVFYSRNPDEGPDEGIQEILFEQNGITYFIRTSARN